MADEQSVTEQPVTGETSITENITEQQLIDFLVKSCMKADSPEAPQQEQVQEAAPTPETEQPQIPSDLLSEYTKLKREYKESMMELISKIIEDYTPIIKNIYTPIKNKLKENPVDEIREISRNFEERIAECSEKEFYQQDKYIINEKI